MTNRLLKTITGFIAFFVLAAGVHGATTDLASSPLVTSQTVSVQPNILYVLDDSGSMDWDCLPDWVGMSPLPTSSTSASDISPSSARNCNQSNSGWTTLPIRNSLYGNSSYNGVAYNPAISYTPPIYYNADGSVNTTTYQTQNSANTSTWSTVKNDGYSVQSTTTSNLVNGAYFYTVVPGEYCAKPNLISCTAQSAPSASYPYPAYLRWCDSSSPLKCQATWTSSTTWGNSAFKYYRMPSQYTETLTLGGSSPSNTTVSHITVNSVEILSATTGSSTGSTLAGYIVTAINACTYSISGQCGTVGYSASASGSTVTIYSPTQQTYTPVLTKGNAGTVTFTATAFGAQSVAAPGALLFTSITSGITSYPYPGTATKATARTDCVGTTCTYAEEMTNYANWWAYYRTRMQMMKTSVSQAFSSIGTNYRVGYMTINNNNNSDFLNVRQFTAANKLSWYNKFFAANPSNSTPLRVALATAGQYYANMAGSSINGVTTTDPMQYSCQQNFTILSTDGYWNENSDPTQLDGSTSVGNQDSAEPRPFNDGGTTLYNQSTSQIQYGQTQLSQSTSQLQSRTIQIQQRTQQVQTRTQQYQSVQGQLYKQTSSNSGSSWTDWASTSTCNQDSSGSSRTACMVGTLQSRTSSNSGSTWSNWGNVSTCATDNSGSSRTQCQVTQNWTNSASTCSPTHTGSSGSYQWTGNASANDCQVASDSGWTNASSCTASDPVGGPAVSCQTADTGFLNASSCSASSSGGQTVTCQSIDSGWVGAGSCTASTSGGATITCQTIAAGPTPTASCACAPSAGGSCTVAAASGNSWTRTTCTSNIISAAAATASCTADPATAANSYVATNCNTVTTGPTSTSSCTASAASSSNSYTATTCAIGSSTGGTPNTLADVAEYYYVHDLRTAALGNCTGASGIDVCSNDVPSSGQDGASWQHMTTFTLGLGASGLMQFTQSYLTASSGDYYDVKNGTVANPSGGVCSWQSSGACNWPAPVSNTQTTIDDLWHAGVNGRATYFSATDPASLATGLSNALAGVSARLGASAAATTSNPNVTSGDNFVFSSTFTTMDWDGELYRQQIDLTSGVVQPDGTGKAQKFDINTTATYDWESQVQLDANGSRTIYTFSSSAGNKLKAFAWANLTATEQAYFQVSNISTLSQFCTSGVTCLPAASKVDSASAGAVGAGGANLVTFLTGDRSNEGVAADTTKYYRARAHLLGDIVNAEAVYVKAPQNQYTDAGYADAATTGVTDFITANASRQGMVYAASNDGMLHAFNATSGAETWAYAPSLVLPTLYKLADKNYTALHQYFVDGTPAVGDICPNAPGGTCTSSQWKTILVGGLNLGGRGYYALDITNPASPKALWEFTDTNMGYTYGNPIITKLVDGTWVVLVTSGYNNVSPGDGVGRLYVLNANTGALIRSISTTGVGSTTTPSGLAHINAWVNSTATDNTSLRAYGGDLLGNLWRFDINNNVGATGYEAERLTTFYSNAAGTTTQPITTKPELGDVNGNAVVFVGTGRFLGTSDLSDTSAQSFYAVKDRLGSAALTPFPNPRASGSGFVQQTLTVTTCPTGSPATICTTGQTVRTGSKNAVDFGTGYGWYIDLPDSGERSNTDPTLALGTLAFTTNVPNVSACTAGGYSYAYFLDYRSGAPVSTSTTNVVGVKLGNALATRLVFVRLPNNTVVALIRMSDGTTLTTNVPIGGGGGVTRRVSWRELISQ